MTSSIVPTTHDEFPGNCRPAEEGAMTIATAAATDRVLAEQFEATAVPHIDSVYHAVLRLTGDPTTAQDLTQETLLRALRSFDTFQTGTNCRAWLLRIAYNTFCKSFRRQRTIGFVDPEDDAVLEQVPAEDPGPEEQVLRQLDREAVQQAIDKLPDAFREAVVLVELKGLTCEQAATVMGTARGTVLSRLHRARGRLRALLLAGPEINAAFDGNTRALVTGIGNRGPR
jgi:RNA polymerase sigma-70 factor, ECF subfamily